MLSRMLAVVLVCLFSAACRRTPPDNGEQKLRRDAQRFAALEATRASKSPELVAELTRLEAEQALPEQLTARRTSEGPGGWIRPDGSQVLDQDNLAPVIEALFTPGELSALRKALDQLYPAERFEWSEKRLEAARDLLRRNAEPLRRFEAALERPAFEPGIQYSQGVLAEHAYLESAMVLNRLLGIRAAEEMASRDLVAALDTWQQMLELPSRLAQVPNLTARSVAVRLRSEALRVLEGAVRHDRFTPADAEHACEVLEQHYAEWPDERAMWSGERAIALHTYEMVRGGELLSLLPFTRVQQLRRTGALGQFTSQVQANIDGDELFYLEAIRRVADEAERNYRERRRTLDELQQELDKRRGSSRFPAIADELLWKDVEWGVRLQACDRALLAGWLALLRAATGRDQAEPLTNPLTGEPFVATQRGGFWELRNIDLLGDDMRLGEEPLLVPVFTAAPPAP